MFFSLAADGGNTGLLLSESSNGASSIDSNLCSITICYQNVCGISTKKEELDIHLNNTDAKKPMYVCITEHFVNFKNVALFNFTNYELITYNVRPNMMSGGSLMIGLNNCNYEKLIICTVLDKQVFVEICGVNMFFVWTIMVNYL